MVAAVETHIWSPGAIRQVIPATGWWAVFMDEEGAYFREPLVAWALWEGWEPGDRSPFVAMTGLIAMDGTVTAATEHPGFDTYAHEQTPGLSKIEPLSIDIPEDPGETE